MKTKYTAVASAVVLGLAATLFAVEKQSGTAAAKLIHLRSNGATIAELKLPKGTEFELTGSESTHDKSSGQITAKRGLNLMPFGNSALPPYLSDPAG